MLDFSLSIHEAQTCARMQTRVWLSSPQSMHTDLRLANPAVTIFNACSSPVLKFRGFCCTVLTKLRDKLCNSTIFLRAICIPLCVNCLSYVDDVTHVVPPLDKSRRMNWWSPDLSDGWCKTLSQEECSWEESPTPTITCHFIVLQECAPVSQAHSLLTLGAHAQEGYGTCPACLFVCLFVCLSVCYHLIVDIVRFYGLPKVLMTLF